MSDKKLKIVFMGSAGFAVPSLDALVSAGHDVALVVAQPCKPAGRGQRMTECAVAYFAQENNLPLYQPRSVKKDECIAHIRDLKPDLIVVVAYGKILPRELIDIPPMGCVNVHASLLPKYRGAAPINWAIANGETATGVTTMFINEELDSGDILLMAKTPIDEVENASALHDRLAMMGADLLLHTIDGLIDGSIKPEPQNHDEASFAPIMKKEDGRIDWTKPADEIFNLIRAFTPWPGTFTELGGKKLRVHEAAPLEMEHGKKAGSVLEAKDHFMVACGKDALCILELQMEGGKRMAAQDFLRGRKLNEGETLG